MGLDMYLTGGKFLRINWANPDENRKEDGFQIESLLLRLGYWREHPDLHGFIVQTFAGGEDRRQKIDPTAEQMRTIVQAVKDRRLPHTEGFFFGRSDDSEEQRAEDVAIFERTIAWLEEKDEKSWRSVDYQASW